MGGDRQADPWPQRELHQESLERNQAKAELKEEEQEKARQRRRQISAVNPSGLHPKQNPSRVEISPTKPNADHCLEFFRIHARQRLLLVDQHPHGRLHAGHAELLRQLWRELAGDSGA